MSKNHFVVAPHRPFFKGVLVVAGVAVFVGLLVGSYFLGRFFAWPAQQQMVERNQSLRKQLVVSEQHLDQFRQQVVLLEQKAIIHQEANQQLQADFVVFQDEKASLEKKLVLYENMMSPGNHKQSVKIEVFKVFPKEEAGQFSYKFVVVQSDKKHSVVQGYAKAKLIGVVGDKSYVIPLQFVARDKVTLEPRIRFRYFQELVGEIKVPDNFVPDSVMVEVKMEGKTPRQFEQQFDWIISTS